MKETFFYTINDKLSFTQIMKKNSFTQFTEGTFYQFLVTKFMKERDV